MSFWYRTLGLVLKLIFGSIVVGLFSGLIIPRVINAFSSDGSFELSELLLTFLIIKQKTLSLNRKFHTIIRISFLSILKLFSLLIGIKLATRSGI